MITLNLLQFIEDNGLGEIDKSLFWQKLPFDANGVYIASIGQTTQRGKFKSTTFELYSRGSNDLTGIKQLKAILDLLDASFNICKLPAVLDNNGNVIAEEVNNVQIMPTSSITNYGQDENNRIIYSATGSIYYH